MPPKIKSEDTINRKDIASPINRTPPNAAMTGTHNCTTDALKRDKDCLLYTSDAADE